MSKIKSISVVFVVLLIIFLTFVCFSVFWKGTIKKNISDSNKKNIDSAECYNIAFVNTQGNFVYNSDDLGDDVEEFRGFGGANGTNISEISLSGDYIITKRGLYDPISNSYVVKDKKHIVYAGNNYVYVEDTLSGAKIFFNNKEVGCLFRDCANLNDENIKKIHSSGVANDALINHSSLIQADGDYVVFLAFPVKDDFAHIFVNEKDYGRGPESIYDSSFSDGNVGFVLKMSDNKKHVFYNGKDYGVGHSVGVKGEHFYFFNEKDLHYDGAYIDSEIDEKSVVIEGDHLLYRKYGKCDNGHEGSYVCSSPMRVFCDRKEVLGTIPIVNDLFYAYHNGKSEEFPLYYIDSTLIRKEAEHYVYKKGVLAKDGHIALVMATYDSAIGENRYNLLYDCKDMGEIMPFVKKNGELDSLRLPDMSNGHIIYPKEIKGNRHLFYDQQDLGKESGFEDVDISGDNYVAIKNRNIYINGKVVGKSVYEKGPVSSNDYWGIPLFVFGNEYIFTDKKDGRNGYYLNYNGKQFGTIQLNLGLEILVDKKRTCK